MRIIADAFAVVFLLILLLPKPDLYNRYSFSGAAYDRGGNLLKVSLSLDAL